MDHTGNRFYRPVVLLAEDSFSMVEVGESQKSGFAVCLVGIERRRLLSVFRLRNLAR